MPREKRREEKGKRSCAYLDLQLGRNSRRLLSHHDMKRSKRKKYEKKEEDRGQREADAEDCIGNVWRTRENRGRGFRLLGENAKVRMKVCVCVCVRETEWKCSEFAVISLNGVDSFPGWKARHEIERLRNNRTTRTPPRFLSRFYFSSFFVEIERRNDVQN